MIPRHWRTPVIRTSAALVVALAALALPAGALGASPPAPATGGALNVGYATATLRGSVDPHGQDSSYFFQYGPTRAYGAQTASADAGAGVRSVIVALPVAGLQPLTTYHYRLIAVNASGAGTGADETFTTAKQPLSLQILAAPNPVSYGATMGVQGTLSGSLNGNRAVALQANPFPYTQGFVNVGNAELTTPAGSFTFVVPGLTQATQFRVITTGAPFIASPVVVETVAVRVSAHIARVRRHVARFYGAVTPPETGMQVSILKLTHGRYVRVAGTFLAPGNASSSRFSRTMRVSSGIYRVFVTITDGAHTSAYSEPLRVG
jgi:hypothetical protein